MKKTINFYEFSRWFEVNRPNNFSRAGLEALYDFLEQYEEETGEQIEFDPIALCCDYTEYEDLDEFKANYTCDKYQQLENWDELEDYTMTMPLGSGLDSKKSCIIQNF
tara:strand:- start:140 stop:463 length:324 start_codon:yes stop_codon:yes gene_type:complete